MTWWRRSPDKTSEASVEQQSAQHYNRAKLYFEQLRFIEAERELREALRLKPAYPEAHDLLGFVLAQLGKGEVGQHAREAIRLKPDSAQLRANLGSELLFENKYAEAERAYREALKLDPSLVVALKGLAESLQRQGKTKEAIGYWQRAMKVEDNPKQLEWIKERLHDAQKEGAR